MQGAIAKGVFLKPRRPGDSLDLQRKPALDIILRTALEIAVGMAYMHQQDVLHCDLSRGDPPGCGNTKCLQIQHQIITATQDTYFTKPMPDA